MSVRKPPRSFPSMDHRNQPPIHELNFNLSAILLAAGESRRMGQQKQLLPWQGTTLLRHACLRLLEALPSKTIVNVVIGANDQLTQAELRELPVRVLIHKEWQAGMLSSLQYGLARLDPCEAVLVALADQPLLNCLDYQSLIQGYLQAQKNDSDSVIATATYAGTFGVPTIFASRLFAAILNQTGAPGGAKELIKKYLAQTVMVVLEHAAFDVDTPEDYAALTRCPLIK